MIHRNFYGYLREELQRGGLWRWGKDRPYREVISKPEVLLAHERAWRRMQQDQKAHD